jgi:hypothetical protein
MKCSRALSSIAISMFEFSVAEDLGEPGRLKQSRMKTREGTAD